MVRWMRLTALSAAAVCLALVQARAADNDRITVKVLEYPDNYKPDGMWSGLYVAESGRVYSGLCTHGGSALFYEYDPATGVNRLVADIGEFMGDKGKGERTHSKIHTRFGEDDRGMIYFATGNQGSGPYSIDPSTWIDKGSHLFRYDHSSGKLEDLGQVVPNFGSYGLVIDRSRRLAYLSCWNNHLVQFDIDRKKSRDLGRVSNWDVNRMIALDGQGNVYGTSDNHWLWKYDVAADRLVELPLQVPHDPTIRLNYENGHPALDRRQNWRYAEWDPVGRKIYGIECGRSLLFEFDPADGEYGSTRLLADMALEVHKREHRFPYAPLAVGLVPGKEVYFCQVSRSFDYGAQDQETEAKTQTFLERYDLKTGGKVVLGTMHSADGRNVLGLEGCEVARDGKVYFCGAVTETNPDKIAGRAAGEDPYSLQLLVWDPATVSASK
ncbi:MAG TPA: hypothetical protein VJ417_04905 [Candidatus Glassbacteria bacterium]|nr:hypothetical protein [Candidatus Glassbacteria bacterium]